MKHFKLLIFIGVSFFKMATLHCFAMDYMTLTNPEGKEIKAEIISVERDSVTIRLASTGKMMKVQMDMFSKASQIEIKEWITKNAIYNELDFGVSKKRFSSKSRETDSYSYKDNYEGYSFRITNSSTVSVKGLSVKYLIVVKRQHTGREKKRDHKIEIVTNTATVPTIPAAETVKFDSNEIILNEAKLKPGWVLSGNGMGEAEDEIEGIIAEFYNGDQLITTVAKPKTLSKQYTATGER